MLPNIPWLFGSVIFVFIAISLLIAVKKPRAQGEVSIVFILLFGASLLLVLTFLLGTSSQPKPQFVELGVYFPLTSTNQNSRLLSIGDKNRATEYKIDVDCGQGELCFDGQIDLTYNQQPDGNNKLTWTVSDGMTGALEVEGPKGQRTADGTTGISIGKEAEKVNIIWSNKGEGAATRTIVLACDLELSPPNAMQPRLVIRHPQAIIESVTLFDDEATRNETGEPAPARSKVYLTSSKQAVGLQSRGAKFVSVLQVAKNSNIRDTYAFIAWPQPGDNCPEGYIVNSGIERLCVPYGVSSSVGTDRGVVFTVISIDKTQRILWALICIAIWITVGFFYHTFIISRISERSEDDELERPSLLLSCDVLLILLPAVQMVLAIRFILCLRVYWWPPNSGDAIESGLLSLIFVPLLIFIGCYAFKLGILTKLSPGILSTLGASGREFRQYLLKEYPPLYFLLAAAALFTFSFLLLYFNSPLDYATADLGFRDWNYFGKSLGLILIGVPIAIFLAGLAMGLSQSGKKDFGPDKDPFTFLLFNVNHNGAGKGEKVHATTHILIYMIALMVIGASAIILDSFAVEASRVSQLICVVPTALSAGALWFLSTWAKRTGKTRVGFMVCFWQNLSIIFGCLAVIFILRTAFLPLHLNRLNPAILCRGFSLRTNTFFEILILVLNVRLLKNFFEDWRQTNENFGLSGVVRWFFLFLAPVFMFGISFLGSRDFGASLVHIPAQIGLLVLVTSSWAIWKYAAGRPAALVAFVVPLLIVLGYYGFVANAMASVVTTGQNTFSQRVLLQQGVDVAMRESEKGGLGLIYAIEQQWRMMNYASAGGVTGNGYGQSPVKEGGDRFRDTTLDELVFSVYLLSEHGVLGGTAVLALYTLILGLIFLGAWRGYTDVAGDDWRELRFGVASALGLMLVFPAIYMAAANVSGVLFTGQNIPLLNLRSESDMLRSGIILMLLMIVMQPFALKKIDSISSSRRKIGDMMGLFVSVLKGRSGKNKKLKDLGYQDDSPTFTGGAVVLTNLLLVSTAVIISLIFSVCYIVLASNNEDYLKNLDYRPLKAKATEHIANNGIWSEPILPGQTAQTACSGQDKNKAAPVGADPAASYRLCIDDNISGGGEKETLATFIKHWNKAERRRGNSENGGQWNDQSQFFILNTDLMGFENVSATEKLKVNQSSKNQASPFRQRTGWDGLLTESGVGKSDAGVLIGENIALPLIGATSGDGSSTKEPGTDVERVNLDEGDVHKPGRGFAIAESKTQNSIFKIGTKRDAPGAMLDAVSGDFDLFINGTPLGNKEAKGSVGRIRLIDGDVIAYAKETNGRRVPTHVFIYSEAKIGAFSFVTWVNGRKDRFYPQGESLPMAKQIAAAISLNREAKNGQPDTSEVALTLKSDLNRDVYNLIRKWRNCLDGKGPAKTCQDMNATPLPIDERTNRRMAVSLMDPHTGFMLALASDDGKRPYDPNEPHVPGDRSEDRQNLNLIRHDVGSAIKPLTASSTLLSFPNLHNMVVADQRTDKRKLFGLTLGSEKEGITSHHSGDIAWDNFLPPSDNLYALTIAMLGMSKLNPGDNVPRFGSGGNYQPLRPPYKITLSDNGAAPEWAEPNMFRPDGPNPEQRLVLLDTPLGRNLTALFDVRTQEPELKSFNNEMWWTSVVSDGSIFEKPNSFDTVSPEITNFAFPKISDYSALRSVLLGGGFNTGSDSLTPYGSIGGKWSNVYLSQSIARIVTGKKVLSSIVVSGSEAPVFEDWFPGAAGSEWRLALLRGLEGVVLDNGGTAQPVLWRVVKNIRGSDQAPRALGSGQADLFTIFAKTGTLGYPGSKIPLKDSSTFMFTAGKWNDPGKRLENGVSGAIYIEQGGMGESQAFAAELIKLLNEKYFKWSPGGRR